MKKIITTGVIMTLLMSSTIASADFTKSPKRVNLNNNTISAVSSCIILDTKNASKKLLSECDGKQNILTGTTLSIISGTGTLISEEEMKKIEKMTDSEKTKYFSEKFPFPIGLSVGTLEASGSITVSSDGKIIEGEFPMNGNVENIQAISTSELIPLSEEEIKKIEKMADSERIKYFSDKFSLSFSKNTVTASGGVTIFSGDIKNSQLLPSMDGKEIKFETGNKKKNDKKASKKQLKKKVKK